MKSLQEYTNDQSKISYLHFINESLQNNVRMINEAKLITEHGKDIDNLLYKFKTYTYNNLYHANSLNEADNTYKLSLNEQQTFRDLMIYICEDYRDKLLEELNIYESLIVDGELITEGTFDNLKSKYKDIVGNVKKTWQVGKEKVKEVIDNIKTKLKEVNELIKEYAMKTVSTVKDMAIKLIGLLNKFNCTLEGLFQKMGFNTEEEGKSVEAIGASLANNPDYLKKNDVYESYANSIKNQILEDENNEDNKDDNKEDNKGEVVKQADKKSTKQMLWEGFKQLMIWAGVCVVIPGIVCGLFQGTLLALLVPIACKLLWNGYKIYKMVKQWKKVKQEWDSYTKKQKWITAIGMVASIIALAVNFGSIANSFGKIWEAFVKSGGNIMAQANLGIQPDTLTRAFGALVKTIKEGKISWEDFQAAFKSITESFAEHIPQADKIVKYTGHVGQKAEDVLQKYVDGNYKTSWGALKEIGKASISPDDVSKLSNDSMVDLLVNGHPDSVYGKALSAAMKAAKVSSDPNHAVNQGLKAIKKLAGSVYSVRVPKEMAIEILKNSGKYAKDGAIYALGATTEVIQHVPVADIVNAATSMLVTIPSIEFAPQNNGGFRVRLGGEKDKKNFIYEVGEDGVRKGKVSDFQNQYNKIKEYVKDVNVKFLEELQKNEDLDEDKKKEIKDNLEKFNQKYQDEIDKQEAIIFYGKPVKEESQNESRIKSLYDYLINEAEESSEKKKYSADDVLLNLQDLRKHLNKKGEDNNSKNDKGKETFNGNVEIILRSVFSTKETGKASKFVYDEEYKPEPYESVRKRVKDEKYKFGPDDINVLAFWFTEWYAGGDKNYYKELCGAFVDVIVLKHQLKNDKEVNDKIITIYKEMIDHLTKAEGFKKEIDGKEWEPNKQWAPLKFDESKVDPDIEDKVKKAEHEGAGDMSKDETEETIEKTGVTIPDEKNKKENSKEETKEDDNDDEIPILMFANVYGIDIANATKSGPRPDPYSLKGAFHSLTFIEIEGGTSKTNIQKMLGDLLSNQVSSLYKIVANKPSGDNEDKPYKLAKWNNGDTERPDFGMLTNQNIIDILNKPEKAGDFVLEKSSISIVKSKKDKDYVKKHEDHYKNQLDNPDEETLKLVKDAYPDAIDNDGKIKKDYKDKDGKTLPQIFAGYSLAQYKAKNTEKSGGFWNKLKNFVKDLFGGDKEKGKKVNLALTHLDKGLNECLYENLNEYDNFLEWCFKPLTLKEFIIEKNIKGTYY